VVVGPQLLPSLLLLQIPRASDCRLHARQVQRRARPQGVGAAETTAAGRPESASRRAGKQAAHVCVCSKQEGMPAAHVFLCAPAQVTAWCARTLCPLLNSFTQGYPQLHSHPPSRPGRSREKGTYTAVMQAQTHARTCSSSSRRSRQRPLARSCCQACCSLSCHKPWTTACTPGRYRGARTHRAWVLRKPQPLGAQSQQAGGQASRPRMFVCVANRRACQPRTFLCAPAQVTAWCAHTLCPLLNSFTPGPPAPSPTPTPTPTLPPRALAGEGHKDTAVMQAQAHARTRSSSSRSSRR